MIGAIVGYVEGESGTDFNEGAMVAAATGIFVAGLTVLSMAVQSFAGFELNVLQSLTLHGALFSNPFAGADMTARLLTVGVSFVYGAGDTLVGWAIQRVIQSLQMDVFDMNR